MRESSLRGPSMHSASADVDRERREVLPRCVPCPQESLDDIQGKYTF